MVVMVSLACSVPFLPTGSAQPAETPTPDALMTALVQTLTAIYAPTDIPTSTSTAIPPTQPPTETPIPFPTITPVPSFTPQPSFTPFGTPPPGVIMTVTPSEDGTIIDGFGCKLIKKTPGNWTVFKSRQSFDASWTVKNIGTKKWMYGGVVVVYVEGAKFHESKDKFFNIPGDVSPNAEAVLMADFIAPKAKGNHVATWGLMETKQKLLFCTFTIMLTVK
jgi:hypothetical protein